MKGTHVSSGSEKKLERRLVVVRRWEHQEDEDLEESNLLAEITSQSKDMGPTCRHVASLNRNVVEHVRSISFADWVSCTNKHWLHRSHRAEKRKQDRGSHGRPHSSRESSPEQHGRFMQSNTANQTEHKMQDPPKRKTTEKCASTRQAAKKRCSEGAAITHETC